MWGAGPLTVRRRRRGGEHPWALLVVLFACVWQKLLPLLRKWSCNAATTKNTPLPMLQNKQGVIRRKTSYVFAFPGAAFPATVHFSESSGARLRGRRLGIRCIFCFGLR